MNLSEAWAMYEVDKRLLGYSKHTLKGYKIQSRLLIRALGDVEIGEVTLVLLKNYLAAQTHLKPSSISHRMRYLKSLFRWAQDDGFVTGNPAAKLREPKMPQRIPKALSDEEIEMLRLGCRTPLENALVEFIYSTGCRIGEVESLNRNTINREDRSVIVFGKGSKEREVYFTIRAGIWLKKYLRARDDDDKALFVTERKFDGKPRRMSISQIRGVIKRIAKQAEVEVNVYPHRLRHSYATHLLNNGAPLELIQGFLGHAKLDTTRLYTHLSGARRREQYQRYF